MQPCNFFLVDEEYNMECLLPETSQCGCEDSWWTIRKGEKQLYKFNIIPPDNVIYFSIADVK